MLWIPVIGVAAARSRAGHLLGHDWRPRRWRELGGRLVSTPAVVRSSKGTWFVGEFGDHTLRVRTWRLGWHRLTAATRHCRRPAATADGSTLRVACLTAHGRVRYATATLQRGELPALSRWRRLGGRTAYTPAVLRVGTHVEVAIVGRDHRLRSRTLGGVWHRRALTCGASPGAGWHSGYPSWVGCAGTDRVVRLLKATPRGWHRRAVSLAQHAQGAVAVVVNGIGDVFACIREPGGAVWVRNLFSGWVTYGGRSLPGVAGAP